MQNSARRLPTFDQANRLEPLARLQAARNYIHRCHLLLISPKADTRFTIPQRVEG